MRFLPPGELPGSARPAGKCSSLLRGPGWGWEGAEAGARRSGLEGAGPRWPQSRPPYLRRGHGLKTPPPLLPLLLRSLSAGLQPWPTAGRKVGRVRCFGGLPTRACRGHAVFLLPQAPSPCDPTGGAGRQRQSGLPSSGPLEPAGRQGCHPRYADEKTETGRNEAVPRSR